MGLFDVHQTDASKERLFVQALGFTDAGLGSRILDKSPGIFVPKWLVGDSMGASKLQEATFGRDFGHKSTKPVRDFGPRKFADADGLPA
ncbi:hypothetical protein RMSM_00729 [Rhodopirellula maiorica SM1]|uniref:Uncharacterized protein n=1 Tax=Rhodopirellula maiorica SM1 TaxID=1265738 RepID=M5S849_9BACT|nr:hypothetical protein RMSM_00729 [Rhodopirellula maiorica SM1]